MRAFSALRALRRPGGRRAGAVLVAVALAAVAGCSSSPPVPASPLNSTKALACPHGARSCTAPGTVRWSVPLPGSASSSISTGQSALNLPDLQSLGIAEFGGIPGDYLATVAVAPSQVVFEPGGRLMVEAIDSVTGKRQWATRLTLPRGAQFLAPGSQLTPTLTDVNGLITAYDPDALTWWLLNAATGAASPPRQIPSSDQASGTGNVTVLPVTARDVALVGWTQVEDVDPVTGTVRWQVPLRPWTGETVIGHVLYADNDRYAEDMSSTGTNSHDQATAIQRVDLASGRLLPALPLAASLRGAGSAIDAPPGASPGYLVVHSNGTTTRLNPATGRVLWSLRMPPDVVGTGAGQAGPDGTVPSLEYLVVPLGSGAGTTGSPPPSPGTRGAIWRVMVISLTNGAVTWVSLGRAFPYSDAGIQTELAVPGVSPWDLYGSVMIASHASAPQQAGSGGYSFTQLEGASPQTGRVLWRGPSVADLYVLGQSESGPPVIIAESCAPAGLAPDPSAGHGDEAFCDSERLYAVNA